MEEYSELYDKIAEVSFDDINGIRDIVEERLSTVLDKIAPRLEGKRALVERCLATFDDFDMAHYLVESMADYLWDRGAREIPHKGS